ncbi:MAG: hypothetical protein GEV11_30015 [Streptosporangiales bacterium]|nr:hypothetical protein [Streptosporangiales bacterium]
MDHPKRQPSGSEPRTARSPLRLRAILSVLALAGGVIVAVIFGPMAARGTGPGAGPWVVAGIGAGVAVIAAIDLVVIARRLRGE